MFRPMTTRTAAGILCYCLACASVLAQGSPRVVHVFVALADNQNQGIVPVPASLGNGLDPARNLYWGSAYGVKTYFLRTGEWTLLLSGQSPKPGVLERCIFKHRTQAVYLVADAYRGGLIQSAILDFLDAAAGASAEEVNVSESPQTTRLSTRGGANLVAYVGHNGLMDSSLPLLPKKKNDAHRDAIVLACASKSYFAEALRASGAYPLLWTTGLMAPEAYTLKSALDGWIAGEDGEKIRDRAAGAYHQFQKCGFRAAHKLLVSGW
jgi:hypothetical protein